MYLRVVILQNYSEEKKSHHYSQHVSNYLTSFTHPWTTLKFSNGNASENRYFRPQLTFFLLPLGDNLISKIEEALIIDFKNMSNHINLNFSLETMISKLISVYKELMWVTSKLK